MAVHTGKEGVVELDAAKVLEVDGFDYTDNVELLESSSLGDDDKAYTPGQGDGSGTINVKFDPDDATGQELLVAGAEIPVLTLYPTGKTAGVKLEGKAWVESEGVTTEKAGIVTKAVAIRGRLARSSTT